MLPGQGRIQDAVSKLQYEKQKTALQAFVISQIFYSMFFLEQISGPCLAI